MPDNILIVYSRSDGKYFCPRVWDVKKKEPFSLLSSQVNIYDPTQQKSKLQQGQSLKLKGPVGPMHGESAGQLSKTLEDVLFSNSQCIGCPPAWLCYLNVFSKYLLRACYGHSSA